MAITSAVAAGVGTAASIGMKVAGAAGAFGGPEAPPTQPGGPQGQNALMGPPPAPTFGQRPQQMQPIGGLPGGGGWM